MPAKAIPTNQELKDKRNSAGTVVRTIARKASGACRVVIDANGDRDVTKERDKPEDEGIGRKERGVPPDHIAIR